MSTPSTPFSRTLIVQTTQRIDRIPTGWPDGLEEGASLELTNPGLYDEGVYRLVIDPENLTATIRKADA